MDPELEAVAGATEAEATTTPVVTEEASPSSGEAAETRSIAEIAVEEFAKEYGPKEEAAQEPAPAEEIPNPDQASEVEQGTEPAAEDPKAIRLTDAEFKALPPKAQQRIGYLTDQARRAKKEVETLTAKTAELQPDVEAMNSFRSFAAERNMRPEDVTKSLNIAGMVQMGHFAEFLEAIQPWYTMALEATGKTVTPDLQALVDSGEMTLEAAQRTTKAERTATLAQERAAGLTAAQKAQTDAAAAHTQRQALVAGIKAAVQTEEAKLRAEDPDYALKAPGIQKAWKAALTRGAVPKTAEEAAEMHREFHGLVMVPPAAKPPLRATDPRPDASSQSGLTAPPTTPLEAVYLGLERAAQAHR